MKSWCDLPWREKRKIEEGEARQYKYVSGYSFDVKRRVQEGQDNKNIKEGV